MTIKMFVNSQYSQIGSLSYKIQLVMQSVFLSIYIFCKTLCKTLWRKQRFLGGAVRHTLQDKTHCKGGRETPWKQEERACVMETATAGLSEVSCGNRSVT